MAQQSDDDLAMLSRAFEDALTDLLLEVLMEGGTSFDQQMKLRLARNRLRRHTDFTEKEYQAAVLRGCSSGAAVRMRRRFAPGHSGDVRCTALPPKDGVCPRPFFPRFATTLPC
jgi:hypothetical protein